MNSAHNVMLCFVPHKKGKKFTGVFIPCKRRQVKKLGVIEEVLH